MFLTDFSFCACSPFVLCTFLLKTTDRKYATLTLKNICESFRSFVTDTELSHVLIMSGCWGIRFPKRISGCLSLRFGNNFWLVKQVTVPGDVLDVSVVTGNGPLASWLSYCLRMPAFHIGVVSLNSQIQLPAHAGPGRWQAFGSLLPAWGPGWSCWFQPQPGPVLATVGICGASQGKGVLSLPTSLCLKKIFLKSCKYWSWNFVE